MIRRAHAERFRGWLAQLPGYVPAAWARHLTGASKAAISLAQSQGRVRSERFTFPDGHVLTLISLQDALRLDVYRRVPWTDDAGLDAPPSHARPRRRRATPPDSAPLSGAINAKPPGGVLPGGRSVPRLDKRGDGGHD